MTKQAPPTRSDFPSMDEWMNAWVGYRLAEGALAVALPGVAHSAVYLHGSIGYDSAITSRGEVWANEYDLDGTNAFQERWRRAQTKDTIAYLVIAARNHPELVALLPSRTPSAQGCASCNGTGEWHIRTAEGDTTVPFPGMICRECSGLGWVAG